MHRSRLAGFIIDSPSNPQAAAEFWGAALGMPPAEAHGDRYIRFDASKRDLTIEVQRVDHAARVHVDIEADDVEAEVRRLEKLGAKRIGQVKTWWVLEAPTGQRFCVVRARDLTNAAGVNVWEE
jgi:hypothetical protein